MAQKRWRQIANIRMLISGFSPAKELGTRPNPKISGYNRVDGWKRRRCVWTRKFSYPQKDIYWKKFLDSCKHGLIALLFVFFLFSCLFVIGWIVKMDRSWKHTPEGKRLRISRKVCKFCPILSNLFQDKSAGVPVQGVCTVWIGEDKCSQDRVKRY